MSFRNRLLLTILVLVTLTTAATLFAAQRQNSASYRAVVDELLAGQSQAFQREQAAGHALATEQVARLASSVRLFAAMEAGDPAVYQVAADELRLGEFDFFRLVDAGGAVITPPGDGRAGGAGLGAAESGLTPPATPASVGQSVQLGFLASAGPDVRAYRVLAAPVSNFGRTVGTLILGQRIMGLDPEEAAPPGGNAHRSALWVGERLVGGNLPQPARRAIADRLALGEGHPGPQLQAGGTSYRYQLAHLNPDSAYPAAYLVSAFDMEGFVAEQRSLALRVLLIGLIAALAAGLAAVALSRQLARPVADLVAATRQIRAGNYEQRLGPSSTLEMNTLAESFNAMAADLALKDRYHSVLQQVADPQIAEELISGRVKLGGELRHVTVMFCDIRGYTPITVGRPPEEVIELLNHHMSAMSRVVQAHGGVINQFAGDSIMALFGAPKSYGDDAERAIRCALAMLAERDRLNRDSAVPMQIGIGIAAGPMVAGCIGAENRSDYTVVGERVNLAARLAAAAKAGEILIDETTEIGIGDRFRCEPLTPLALKGFAHPIPAHRLTVNTMAPT
jgi:class 3 adenylate cyclase